MMSLILSFKLKSQFSPRALKTANHYTKYQTGLGLGFKLLALATTSVSRHSDLSLS